MTQNLLIETVPGTVHLVDLDHNIHSLHAEKGDIVLDPTPSADPEDPLNWLKWRKSLATTCICLYVKDPHSHEFRS